MYGLHEFSRRHSIGHFIKTKRKRAGPTISTDYDASDECRLQHLEMGNWLHRRYSCQKWSLMLSIGLCHSSGDRHAILKAYNWSKLVLHQDTLSISEVWYRSDKTEMPPRNRFNLEWKGGAEIIQILVLAVLNIQTKPAVSSCFPQPNLLLPRPMLCSKTKLQTLTAKMGHLLLPTGRNQYQELETGKCIEKHSRGNNLGTYAVFVAPSIFRWPPCQQPLYQKYDQNITGHL